MDQRRKFRKKKQNLLQVKGDVLINVYVDSLGEQINSNLAHAMQCAHNVEERDAIRYTLITVNALIEAVSDIACWGSETNCNEVHERVGAWREISDTIQRLADIQHL